MIGGIKDYPFIEVLTLMNEYLLGKGASLMGTVHLLEGVKKKSESQKNREKILNFSWKQIS